MHAAAQRNYQTMTECRIMIVLRPNMQPAKVEEMICLGITSIAAMVFIGFCA